MTSVLRLIALFTGLVFLTSTGTKAAPKAKPKTKPATHLTIDNQRSAVLVQLISLVKPTKSAHHLLWLMVLRLAKKLKCHSLKLDASIQSMACLMMRRQFRLTNLTSVKIIH